MQITNADNLRSSGPLLEMVKSSYFVLNYIWNLGLCPFTFKIWILVLLILYSYCEA